jgi:glutaredoxin
MPIWRRRRRRITLYGKPGCHLCEEAAQLLMRLSRRYPLEITEVDITSNPDLYRRYDIVIPVIVVDGVVELQAPIEEGALKEALRQAG